MKTIYTILFFLGISSSLYAQEKFVTTSDSVKLYINIKGEGTPCLFIHGGPGQGSNYWEKLAGDFCEDQFKMIYLDQRGSGRSSSPKDFNYSPERMIKDFEEIRENLGIEKWLIMGHSFGGILQTMYANKHPERITSILMFNCTLNLEKSMEESYLPAVYAFFNLKKDSIILDRNVPFSKRLDSVQKLFSTREDVWKLSFASLESAIKFTETYHGFQKWNTDFRDYVFKTVDYMEDFTYLTENINIPVLFLYGKTDLNVGVDHYLDLKFPHLTLYPINGGHMEFIQKEKDSYIESIKLFREEINL